MVSSDSPVDGAEPVYLPRESNAASPAYFLRPAPNLLTTQSTVDLFPVVLCSDGAPWAEANLWLIDMLQTRTYPNMLSFASNAEDLAAYRRFIEDSGIDWLDFSVFKLRRPTYRYNANLITAVRSREISGKTAKRRMATVIRFYRWLMEDGVFQPENPPWRDSDRYIQWKDDRGFSRVIATKTTDVSIKTSETKDVSDEYIEDGGRMRPIPQCEQEVLLDALDSIDNTEMTLIHCFALLTGARIQTVLTIRVGNIRRLSRKVSGLDVWLRAGPGTGIDTKGDKIGTLRIPSWFFQQLRIYERSPRAAARRTKANGGDHDDQFLFLSHRGMPLYEARSERYATGPGGRKRRHAKTGQGVRQFIRERLLPEMRKRLANEHYEFSFHDLRATFGMNVVDELTKSENPQSYGEALDHLSGLMWHSSMAVTERYLKYRDKLKRAAAVQTGWNAQLQTRMQRAAVSR